MKALKVCTYIVALAVSIGFYLKSDQLVKKMETLDQSAYASAPAPVAASVAVPAQPAEPAVTQPAPAPVVAPPEPPKLAPVLLPGAGASVYLGGASQNAKLTGKVYRTADLVPGGTPPQAPADTSPPHIIIDVGKLDPSAALHDRRLNCTEVSPGRISCASKES